MYSYRAYGLAIASEATLPELVPADFAAADVTIRRQRINRVLPGDTPVAFDIRPRVAYLAWSEVGAFLVEDGRRILADLRPGTPDDLARLPLLGAVLAVLLYQRGFLVLHASAVAVAGRAVILVGDKGSGKSTMAAALFARGHRLIADDVVAVDCTNSAGPKVVPGYPQLKLSSAAATVVLRERGDDLVPIHRHSGKLCYPVSEGRFTSHPVPPGQICALAKGERLRDVPVTPQEALITLLRHSYMARFGSQILGRAAASMHLQRSVTLAGCAPVSRLELPGALHDLDRAAYLVEATLAQASTAAVAHL